MEHQKKKRGISLIKHQRTHSMQPATTQSSEAPTTHFNYSRYAGPQNITRHTSTPRPQVNFMYSVRPPASLIPTPPEPQQPKPALENSNIAKLFTPQIDIKPDTERSVIPEYKEPNVYKYEPSEPNVYKYEPSEPNVFKYEPKEQEVQDIERYYSFEHCKEVIGTKLFGQSPKISKVSQ